MDKIMGKVKRALSVVLVAAMIVTCIPQTALSVSAAQDSEAAAGTVVLNESGDTSNQVKIVESDTAADNLTDGASDDVSDPEADVTAPKTEITGDDISGDQMPDVSDGEETAEEGEPTEEPVSIPEMELENDMELQADGKAYVVAVKVLVNGEENAAAVDYSINTTTEGAVENFTFMLTKADGYQITEVKAYTTETYDSDSPAEVPVTAPVEGGDFYYSIALADITADITIEIKAEEETDIAAHVLDFYTVTTEITQANETDTATIAYKDNCVSDGRIEKDKDLNFTVEPIKNYVITSVSYQLGSGNETALTPDDDTNIYQITKEEIAEADLNDGDSIKISVVTAKKIAVTFAAAEGTSKDTYSVYQVTKADRNEWNIGAKIDGTLEGIAGEDIYFTVVPASDKYQIYQLTAVRNGKKVSVKSKGALTIVSDGKESKSAVYGMDGRVLTDDTAVTVKMRLNRTKANRINYKKSAKEGAERNYTVTVDDLTAEQSSSTCYTAKDSLTVTVSPEEGYEVVEVTMQKTGSTEQKEVSLTRKEDGTADFECTFEKSEDSKATPKPITYTIFVRAKALEVEEGITVSFHLDDSVDKLKLNVIETAGVEAVPAAGADKQYKVSNGTRLVEFTVTAGSNKVVPQVTVGSKSIRTAGEDNLTFRYKVSASLLADDPTVTISQKAAQRTLRVQYDAESIADVEGIYIIVGDNNEDKRRPDWSYPDDDDNTIAEWDVDVDSKIALTVTAGLNCRIKSYKVGSSSKTVNGDSFTHSLTLTQDTNVVVNSEILSIAKLTVVEESGDIVELLKEAGSYAVNYNCDYEAYIVRGKDNNNVTLSDARITPQTAGSTATFYGGSTADIHISPRDAGKTLTLTLYTEDDNGNNKAAATYALKVKSAITAASIKGVNGKKLSQAADTSISYAVTTTPANLNADLDVDVIWSGEATEEDKAVFRAELITGKLVITTSEARGTEEAAMLKEAAAKATIRLADKTKGEKEDGNYPEDAIISGTDFSLTITEPALGNLTPVVSLSSSDDVSLTLTLGTPNNMPAAPVEGNRWYAVSVAPQGNPAAEDELKEAAMHYYKVTDAPITERIVVSKAPFGRGKEWTFDVRVQFVQTWNDCDMSDTNMDDAQKEEALTGFVSKENTSLTGTKGASTKNPYYTTKLSLKKGAATVYTGQKDIAIATISFDKNATYTQDMSITVEDRTEPGNKQIDFSVKNGVVKMSVSSDDPNQMTDVKLGKHTIRVTATAPDKTYKAYAELAVTINRGVEKLTLSTPSRRIYKGNNQAATLKVTPVYNDNAVKGTANDAKLKKVQDYVLVEVDENDNVKKDETGKDIITTFNGLVTVKNGTVTVAKAYDAAAAEANHTNRFRVRATAADWKGNTTVGYSLPITITSQKAELGNVILVRQTAEDQYEAVVTANGEQRTSGELEGALIRVLQKGISIKKEGVSYTGDDFVDITTYGLTFKSSNTALTLNPSTGQIVKVGKAAKNIKLTVSANDGSKNSAVLDKLEIINAKPTKLGLKAEYREYEPERNDNGLYSAYSYNEIDSDYEKADLSFTGTADSVLRLTVMRSEGDNGGWSVLDELSDVKVTIGNAKVLDKTSAYNQEYIVIANQAAMTVKLDYTGADSAKHTETYTITNHGFKADNNSKISVAKVSGSLIAGLYDKEQTITYTMNLPTDYEVNDHSVVMIRADATDRSNVKNIDRYLALEKQGNVNGWMQLGETTQNGKKCGIFDLNFSAAAENEDSYTNIPAGSYKLQMTCGTLNANGEFIPQTKSVTVTLKAAAPKTVKGSYKPVTAVKMSLYDTAAGRVLAGTGKSYTSEKYEELLNANITGRANHFRELFTLDPDTNTLILSKGGFSEGLKAAVKESEKLTGEVTDEDVIRYITESKTKEAKNDRIGYIKYSVHVMNGNEYQKVCGITKITVTFDNKKSTDTYALTNAVILEDTEQATVNVLMNKKPGMAKITDAYVISCDKEGGFEVQSIENGAITLKVNSASLNKGRKNTYKVTMQVFPENNFYSNEIKAKKEAWLAASEDEKEAKLKEYKELLAQYSKTVKGITLTTQITIGPKASTGNKVSVVKSNLNQTFTGTWSGLQTAGSEAGYDGIRQNYWIHVPFAKNMPCDIAYIESADSYLLTKREDESKNLVRFSTLIQDWDSKRADYGKEFIDIGLNKQELDAVIAGAPKGAVQYSTDKKKVTLTVKATVHFGNQWIAEEGNPDGGHWDTGYNETTGKDAIQTETITFKLTLPAQPKESSYAEAVEKVTQNTEALAESAIPIYWVWNGEGLPLPDAENGKITIARLEKEQLFDKLNELIDNVRAKVEEYAPEDTDTRIYMEQAPVDTDAGETITLNTDDLKVPTLTTEGTFSIRVSLINTTTLGENEEIIEEGDNKTEITPVTIELTIPALKEKPADVEQALTAFISEKVNGTNYTFEKEVGDRIAEDARKALNLVDKDGKPLNTLRLYVDVDWENSKAPTTEEGGHVEGRIGVYGYRYGGKELKKDFQFDINKLTE